MLLILITCNLLVGLVSIDTDIKRNELAMNHRADNSIQEASSRSRELWKYAGAIMVLVVILVVGLIVILDTRSDISQDYLAQSFFYGKSYTH